MKTLGFIRDNKYTNLAFIFSDQYDVDTKIGVYSGLDRAVFKSKKEFSGSIIRQIDRTLEYFEVCNETRIIIDGSPMRKEFESYNLIAAREAILNCYCHRDYAKRSNIKIEFFTDRCEILSPGGFYGGLTLEDALNGLQSFRNKYLVKLLHKLGYIENYSSGLNRIFKEYENKLLQPIITTSLNMFKVTFPNTNYEHTNKICEAIDFSTIGTLNGTLNNYEEQIIKLIINNNKITRKELANTLNVSVRTIQRIISKSDRISYIGIGKSGHWQIKKHQNQF